MKQCLLSPVVHDGKLAIRWHKLQGSLSVKAIQRDAFMEVAVVQHDCILGGATPMAVVMAMSATSSADCQRVIQRKADGWVPCKVALDLRAANSQWSMPQLKTTVPRCCPSEMSETLEGGDVMCLAGACSPGQRSTPNHRSRAARSDSA